MTLSCDIKYFSLVCIQKSWYFNLNPSRVITHGSCGEDIATLFLTLPGYGASLQFEFKKVKQHIK